MDMGTVVTYSIAIIFIGLMLRFVAQCWVQMKAAITGYQFFTAVLRLMVGILCFPLTILFQMLQVSFGDY